jgi:hypothetical protein
MFCKILRQGHVKINTKCHVPWVTTSLLSVNKETRIELAFLCIKYHLELLRIPYKGIHNIRVIWIALGQEHESINVVLLVLFPSFDSSICSNIQEDSIK